MLTPEQRAQTLPETTTTASNKATNTSSLSIVSIGMPGSLLRSLLSATNPDDAPPQSGAKPPRMGTGLAAPCRKRLISEASFEALPSRQPPRRLFLHPPRKDFS